MKSPETKDSTGKQVFDLIETTLMAVSGLTFDDVLRESTATTPEELAQAKHDNIMKTLNHQGIQCEKGSLGNP